MHVSKRFMTSEFSLTRCCSRLMSWSPFRRLALATLAEAIVSNIWPFSFSRLNLCPLGVFLSLLLLLKREEPPEEDVEPNVTGLLDEEGFCGGSGRRGCGVGGGECSSRSRAASASCSRMIRDCCGWGLLLRGSSLCNAAMRSKPGVPLYATAHCLNRRFTRLRTSASTVSSRANIRKRSRRGSSAKAFWNLDPAFWINASKITNARIWRCAFPYFLTCCKSSSKKSKGITYSFFLSARAASVGPVD